MIQFFFIIISGIVERTLIFYGMYSHQIFGYVNDNYTSIENDTEAGFYYDLPLAYIAVTVCYYLAVLVAIVRSAAKEFKDRLVESEGVFYQYSSLIFGSWDYCIDNEKSANYKHKALYNEIQALIHQKRLEFERTNRSRETMLKLIVVRFFVNLIVVIILAIAAVVIYLLFDISRGHLEPNFKSEPAYSYKDLKNYVTIYLSTPTNSTTTSLVSRDHPYNIEMGNNGGITSSSFGTSGVTSDVIRAEPLRSRSLLSSDFPWDEQLDTLYWEFLPFLGIVLFNLLVPLLFNYLVKFEQYSPVFVIKVTLLRTVFLRLSSLAVLLSRFYHLISRNSSSDKCYSVDKGTPACWETFVGQSFFKLILTDFITHCLVTFFINFPRALIGRHCESKFAKFIGEQEFELSKHFLDIVYSQTLLWIGTFYAPFLPLIASILNFLMFYVKKFACLHNCKPSLVLYRASRSNSLFMLILLLAYSISVVPIIYGVSSIPPSRSCGPFRDQVIVWDTAIGAFLRMPMFIQKIIFFVGTPSFAVPFFITLVLFLYYYWAVSAANKKFVELLRNQLVLEGHDKQFLLNRLSTFIKQQQEYQKRIRLSEMQRDNRDKHRDKDLSKASGIDV